MKIYELNKKITEAGLGKAAYDFAKRQARNYMSRKTGMPADVFKNKAERDEEKAEAERREIEAAVKSKVAAQRKQAAIDAALGKLPSNPTTPSTTTAQPSITPAPVTAPTTVAQSPEQIRQQKQAAAAKVAQTQMAANQAAQTAATPVAQSPEQIRQQKQAAATQAARAQMAAPTVATAPAVAARATTEPTAQQSAMGVRQINQLIPTIRTRDLNSIKKNIDTVLTKRQKPAVAAAPTSAMPAMATQLTNKPVASSTGGKTVTTPTGLVHTAKAATPAAPAAAAPQWTGRKPKVSAPPPAGAPTSAEYANLEKRLQQAMAAQGQTK